MTSSIYRLNKRVELRAYVKHWRNARMQLVRVNATVGQWSISYNLIKQLVNAQSRIGLSLHILSSKVSHQWSISYSWTVIGHSVHHLVALLTSARRQRVSCIRHLPSSESLRCAEDVPAAPSRATRRRPSTARARSRPARKRQCNAIHE